MNEHRPALGADQVYVPDNLVADDFPIVTDSAPVLTGNNLSRGRLIEVDGAGKFIPASAVANIHGILAQDTDATAADKEAGAYISAKVLRSEVDFGALDEAQSIAFLRSIGIYVVDSI